MITNSTVPAWLALAGLTLIAPAGPRIVESNPVNDGQQALKPSQALTNLPEEVLARHDFFYAGEAKQERMFIVRGGQIRHTSPLSYAD